MKPRSMFRKAPLALLSLVSLFVTGSHGLNFTASGGQIFTPGLAIVDAPQPGTPLGGDTIQVALEISGNGKIPIPPYESDNPTQIHNITIFLYSYTTGKNFTISNGTATANNASLSEIMQQEPGSTVKHVNWVWPDCLEGDGQPTTADSARGVYNISIRQNFLLNGVNHYTIFDLPISVTNRIGSDVTRPSCDSLNNPLLTPEQINATAANSDVPILFAPNESTVIQTSGGDGGSSDGLGPTKPQATAQDGLGGAGMLDWRASAYWVCMVSLVWVFVL